MSGNKAMRRALQTSDVARISNAVVPLISDTTEWISPQDAEEMLTRNKSNRPVDWRKVEEYAEIMRKGEWKFHPQGIIFDPDGTILTGQTRLWAIIFAGVSLHMRVSRGCPAEAANTIDRGRPQSARDLSSRKTKRKHSPIEASLCRAICTLRGIKPSVDSIAAVMIEKDAILGGLLRETVREKKTKSLLMILAVIAEVATDEKHALRYVMKSRLLADKLETELLPYTPESCWGRGVSFGMAMHKARILIGVD